MHTHAKAWGAEGLRRVRRALEFKERAWDGPGELAN
jgi:hypothetical protein